jgi:hypothetical protein
MAIGTERRPARAGTGSCTKCTCSRFEGHASICENCKHHYDEHNVAWLRFQLARHRAYRHAFDLVVEEGSTLTEQGLSMSRMLHDTPSPCGPPPAAPSPRGSPDQAMGALT